MAQDETGTYADRVTITFEQIDGMPGISNVIDTYQLIVHPHGTIDLVWLNQELESLFRQSEPDPESGVRLQTSPFVLSQKRHHHSWGATAVAVQFLIETSAYLGPTSAAAAVGYGIRELIDKLKERGHDVIAGKPEVLTDAEAIKRGLAAIELHYAPSVADLTPKSVGTNESGQHVVTATDTTGSTYSVTFTVRGGETTVVSRNRDLGPGSDTLN